jgi:hypothetical protein
MPVRLADIKNVKDFGAIGDGRHDDTSAIQAAIDYFQNNTTSYYGAAGQIFFPPGYYSVTAPLTLNYTGALSIVLFGELGASTILGNVAGYIIDRQLATYAPSIGIRVIEKLNIVNTNKTTGGCIRLSSTIGGAVRDCNLSGFSGVITEDANYASESDWVSQSIIVENCTIRGNWVDSAVPTGSIGVSTSGNGVISNCDFHGWDVAVNMEGIGVQMMGCRAEVCNAGVRCGTFPNGTKGGKGLGNFVIGGGCSFEACVTGIDFPYPAWDGLITGISILGHPAPACPNGAASQYGINCRTNTVHNVVFAGVASSGGNAVAAIAIGDTYQPAYLTFISCEAYNNVGVPWSMPSTAYTAKWINCNNPAPIFTYAKLTPTITGAIPPTEGDEYTISNGPNSPTWGQVVNSGNLGTTHVKVRYNGSAWTVVGV